MRRKFDLKPYLIDGFRLSTDPLFVEEVVEVVRLYHKAVALCFDEKPQVHAQNWSQPVLPMMPDMPGRGTLDYAHDGVTSLFVAFNIADGTVISELHRRHRQQESLKLLKKLDKNVPSGLGVHLVCDNYGTHRIRRSRTGWPGTPASPCTSPRPDRRRSIRSSAGSAT